MNLTTETLLQLRSNARLQRDTMLEHRVRDGEDPATSYDEVPGVDELVVLELRDQLLEDRGRLSEFGLARLAGRSSAPDASEHRHNADRLEFELFREIAAAAPGLTPAVWRLSGALDVA